MKMKQIFKIIGINDNPKQELLSEALEAIAQGKVFSGGKRHYELMRDRLPQGAQWIEITVPLSKVFGQYKEHKEIVVFASGDPLFYGFAATVQRELPDAGIVLYPCFNSLQMLAHKALLAYQDMRAVSLTGRPWREFDTSLIRGERMIGLLTDHNKTPQQICARMLEYGYDNYSVYVGQMMGNPENERVDKLTVNECAAHSGFGFPNCMILLQTAKRDRPFGIDESRFELLDGRVNMITKMPVRLMTLAALDLGNRSSFWDVGFCTGSVSIEAKLQFPQIEVTAFERREEGARLMEMNSRRFGTPGITSVIGDFTETDAAAYPAPDAVFIGGHGGRMERMLEIIDSVLLPGGVIVFNSVSDESAELFRQGIAHINRRITNCTRVAVDEHNPILIMKAE